MHKCKALFLFLFLCGNCIYAQTFQGTIIVKIRQRTTDTKLFLLKKSFDYLSEDKKRATLDALQQMREKGVDPKSLIKTTEKSLTFYIQDPKICAEFISPTHNHKTIYDADAKTITLLIPAEKKYALNYAQKLFSDPEQPGKSAPPSEIEWSGTGRIRYINDFLCEEYVRTAVNTEADFWITSEYRFDSIFFEPDFLKFTWYADIFFKDLLLLDGFPILWVIRGGYTEVTNEITDIKPGNVDQNIFSLPNDYTKISWQEAVQLKGDLLVTDKKKQKPAKDISK